MNKFGCVLLYLLSAFDLYAGDSTVVSFSIGNRYAFSGTHRCMGWIWPNTVSYSEKIIADTIIKGHKYSIFLRSQKLDYWAYYPGDTSVTAYRRADSTTIYQFNVSTMIEDTIVNFKDTIGTVYSYGFSIIFKDTLPVFIADEYYPQVEMDGGRIYASKLFLIHYWTWGLCEEDISLKGALIDGIYYGDTTLVSVNTQLNNKVTCLDYVLFQNYPNPFNPMTQIEFYSPNNGYVSLKLFDIMGRQVAALVEGIMQSGSHIVVFDGSNLSSGIYFYCLQGGTSIITKKLILLK